MRRGAGVADYSEHPGTKWLRDHWNDALQKQYEDKCIAVNDLGIVVDADTFDHLLDKLNEKGISSESVAIAYIEPGMPVL